MTVTRRATWLNVLLGGLLCGYGALHQIQLVFEPLHLLFVLVELRLRHPAYFVRLQRSKLGGKDAGGLLLRQLTALAS